MALRLADAAPAACARVEGRARDDRELVLGQAEVRIGEGAGRGVDVRVRPLDHAAVLQHRDREGDAPLLRRARDGLRVVQERHGVERRAEHEHLPAGRHEAGERGVLPVAVGDRVRVGEPSRPRADRGDARLGVDAALRPRPGADPLGDAAVVAVHRAGGGVEDRRVGEVGLAVGLRPVLRVVDVLLPRGVRGERALRPERVEQRPHHRLRAADHPAEGGHAGVDQDDPGRADAQAPQVLGQLGAMDGARVSVGAAHRLAGKGRSPGGWVTVAR
ncbi:MAG: hypothetical protein AVDCRST_MAG30-2559 [uncultured Solirubrobacteraceae bacterium]|uniref:Uncharacterized protein n=1 Tax=uncultured Solirubrobacteraceae bacterium TaxID=1162706 RepID=A0A6J4T2K4_9ACTN|nr:MAG: hypothetical protein AVDCRST_MAG30-2559 [uncultured Solirubrobacteraceae bacterium]